MVIFSRFIFKKGANITGISFYLRGFSFNVAGYFLSLLLTLLGLFIIAFSLTKPQSGIKKEKIISQGIDIMICLDVSGSMLTNDFLKQPRIEAAKSILLNFIDKRKGDRIGLVTFGESSMIKCPATLNYNILKTIISKIKIDPDKSNSSRTAIGVGLASAINRLLKLNDNEKPGNKIIILVTDGKNNSGEITPDAASEIAKQMGIKIYTIGIGFNEEIDMDILQRIADMTGSKFFHAQNSGELGPIFNEIDKIEKHKIESYEYTRFKDIGFKYAYIGIIVFLIGLFMNSFLFKRLI
jgi:Ca-activated chloride channel family protein